jgi:hypothetical protein
LTPHFLPTLVDLYESFHYRTLFKRLEPSAWSLESAGGARFVAPAALPDSLPGPLQALTEQRPPIIPGSRGNKKCPVVSESYRR